MHKFEDVNGDEWEIELNVAMTKRVRKEIDVDLNALSESTITDISTNPEKLVDIISVICTDQIKKRELDEYGFAACMVNDAIDNAYEALAKELVFISRRSQRGVVAKAWEKVAQAEEKLTTAQMQMLNSPEMDEKIDGMIQDVQEKFASL